MPGKRSAEAQKRRSEKGARHVYAALQRRETTVAIREVAARRREEMAPQINHTSLVVAQAAVAEMQQAVRLQAHQLDPEYVNRGETLRAAATKGAPRTRALPLPARETDSICPLAQLSLWRGRRGFQGRSASSPRTSSLR